MCSQCLHVSCTVTCTSGSDSDFLDIRGNFWRVVPHFSVEGRKTAFPVSHLDENLETPYRL